MKKEKILFKKIIKGKTNTKITKFGLKKIFNKGPAIFPFKHTSYQKREEPPIPGTNPNLIHPELNRSLSFNPSNYNSSDSNKKKNLAYHDALNHRELYQELINEGVYPTGTKVKIKKAKHSNNYLLELSMPQVNKEFYDVLKKKEYVMDKSNVQLEEIEKMLIKKENVENKIRQIVKKVGTKLSHGKKYKPNFYADIEEKFNYGIDKKGRVIYFDQHVLREKLPFEDRKPKKSLEKKLTSIMGISGIALSIIFLSPNLTGNAIANLTTKSSSIIGVGLFLIGIVGSYFWFKKR